MADRGGEQDEAALRARLDRLSGELDAQRREAEARTAGSRSGREGRAISYGFRLASEFVAGVAVGALIGYGLDRWLGSSPLWTIIFFLLGFAAGVMNVIRAAGRPELTGGDDAEPPEGGQKRG